MNCGSLMKAHKTNLQCSWCTYLPTLDSKVIFIDSIYFSLQVPWLCSPSHIPFWPGTQSLRPLTDFVLTHKWQNSLKELSLIWGNCSMIVMIITLKYSPWFKIKCAGVFKMARLTTVRKNFPRSLCIIFLIVRWFCDVRGLDEWINKLECPYSEILLINKKE